MGKFNLKEIESDRDLGKAWATKSRKKKGVIIQLVNDNHRPAHRVFLNLVLLSYSSHLSLALHFFVFLSISRRCCGESHTPVTPRFQMPCQKNII